MKLKTYFKLLIVLCLLLGKQVKAQNDTFKMAFCSEMSVDGDVEISLQHKGQTFVLQRISGNTFKHPYHYIKENDTTAVIVIKLRHCTVKLTGLSRVMFSPLWKLCLSRYRHFKQHGDYQFDLSYYGGYTIGGFLICEGKDSRGKPLLTHSP